ncbi:glycosyltransferase [Segetibacter sp.]|uniref:glycosyltransferase family 2 protein n=1 Tax=Segetibacter sp. TaxID=2231182 RepID=UPI002615D6D4|nr:glycosyltransferase [Segetibacter sp.]MCW3079597.1 glycosyltransferase [Segetibacter sp.]
MATSTSELSTPISVILPVYNGGEYLMLSVQSVLEQSVDDFEFLILDDCSTDGSWNYINSIGDPRVSVFKNDKNSGLFFNLNFLIKKSKSRLIKLWSQDDIMYKNCLETVIEFHQKYPEIGFSYSGRDIIDRKGEIIRRNDEDKTPEIISTDLHALIAFFTGSIAGNIANVCLNSTALDKIGLFKEDMKISADFDMWVRLAKYYSTGFIRDSLIQLRDHTGQLSRNESLLINHVREDLQIYRYLLSYVSDPIKKRGLSMLRKHKFVFYYTLMIKTLLKGKIAAFYAYYKQLSSFDNFFILTFYFIKGKLFKPGKPEFIV